MFYKVQKQVQWLRDAVKEPVSLCLVDLPSFNMWLLFS